jgi:hypothetical protein
VRRVRRLRRSSATWALLLRLFSRVSAGPEPRGPALGPARCAGIYLGVWATWRDHSWFCAPGPSALYRMSLHMFGIAWVRDFP